MSNALYDAWEYALRAKLDLLPSTNPKKEEKSEQSVRYKRPLFANFGLFMPRREQAEEELETGT
jgi:hypothetical protein